MEQNIHVRPADAALAPVLGRIMAASFRAAFSDFITEETMDRCAVAENCAGLLGSLIKAGEMSIVVGYVNHEPMGLLVYSRREDGMTELEAIHTLPESWGTGLGAALLAFAREHTDARRGAGLWAFAKNARARRFYEKHGFAFSGETRISEFDGAEEVRYEVKWNE